ncbi:hypothetical protein REH65_33345 (plasmid) [Saccharopolyspora sp. ID03-671]|uniref:hypothetical protein n=1 Tax=Saccharopolyspora sp. ID03-671 TaxID=3073066 RepID=UPI0030F39793
MMSQPQENNEMGDVVQGPWAASEPARGQVIDAEIVEDSTAVTPKPQAPRPAAPMVRSYRPLTVQQAGGRYAYGRSLVAAGAKRIPSAMADAVLNRVKLAHLREGNHHRGDILPAQRNVYETEMRERRERRRKIAKAFFVRKAHVTKHGRRGTSVKEAVRPRWETVVPIGAEVANVAYPNTPVLSPLVDGANGAVGGFFDALLGNVGTAVTDFAAGTPGALTIAGGLAGLVAWQATREHQDRQSKLVELMSADGNADLMPDVPADVITAAFRHAGVLKSGSANTPGQHVELLSPVVDDGDAWTARLQLPKGMTYVKVAKRRSELASALDTDTKNISIAPKPGAERQLTLTVYRTLPFTGAPVAHPVISNNRRISFAREGFPVGLDLNGQTVSIRLSRKSSPHGLIVAASGMGKTVHLRNLILSALGSDDAEIGGVYDGKASGDYDVLREGMDWYMDQQESAAWWPVLADLLEQEVANLPERQRRIKAGENVPMRLIILDEFQNAFGKPSERTSSKKDDEPPSAAYRVVAAAEEISRLGRAAGVALVLASQQFDGNVLPSAIEANLLWRIVGYVSSSSVAPKDSVGEAAALYNLEPEKEFTRDQQGAAIVIAPGIDQYATARGWFQDDDVIAEAVRELVGERAAQAHSGPVLQVVDGDQADAETEVDVPEISATTRQVLAAAAEVYADDDAEWIAAHALYVEVVEGELGLTADQALRTEVGRELVGAGVERTRKDLGEGKVTVFRRSDLVEIGGGLEAAA